MSPKVLPPVEGPGWFSVSANGIAICPVVFAGFTVVTNTQSHGANNLTTQFI